MTADQSKSSKKIESEWIRELAAILEETGLTEIEIEKDAVRLRVARQGAPVSYAAAPAAPAAAASGNAPAAAPSEAEHPGAVKSPMVGTAYHAAQPGATPFVQEGATVSEGQTVMIVEAMKTMNQIPAPTSGTVKRILVEDGAPVEFGAPLMVVE